MFCVGGVILVEARHHGADPVPNALEKVALPGVIAHPRVKHRKEFAVTFRNLGVRVRRRLFVPCRVLHFGSGSLDLSSQERQ